MGSEAEVLTLEKTKKKGDGRGLDYVIIEEVGRGSVPLLRRLRRRVGGVARRGAHQ